MQEQFPLWGRDTEALARESLRAGFRAVVVCVDLARLDVSWAGREFDAPFLEALPAGADPCGENGAFHTFVYDGPVFRRPVAFRRGAVVVERDGFAFVHLLTNRRSKGKAASPHMRITHAWLGELNPPDEPSRVVSLAPNAT